LFFFCVQVYFEQKRIKTRNEYFNLIPLVIHFSMFLKTFKLFVLGLEEEPKRIFTFDFGKNELQNGKLKRKKFFSSLKNIPIFLLKIYMFYVICFIHLFVPTLGLREREAKMILFF
jgi:hypothetical protein